jgi:hypothetical protein
VASSSVALILRATLPLPWYGSQLYQGTFTDQQTLPQHRTPPLGLFFFRTSDIEQCLTLQTALPGVMATTAMLCS